MHFIDLQKQYQHLKRRIDKRIQQVLNHGQYVMGPEVYELEERLADYVGVNHAITCANGTDALQLSLMALDIKKDDAVFCPTFTFFSTAETIALQGATPVFVDSDKNTFNICTTDLEQRIKKVINEGRYTPKAIIAVDLFGLPANYPELEKIAINYDLKLIEDAAQGFGGEINTKKAGGFGDIATTSFFPAKPLGCYGDGGAIFTDSDKYAEILQSLRVHGRGVDKYDNIRIGMNSRLDTIQAAILLEKLEAFPQELLNRNNIASAYNKSIDSKFLPPEIPDNAISSWALYTLQSKCRDKVINKLKSQGIPCMIYYKTCLHQQTVFKSINQHEDAFPIAEQFTNNVFSLPMHPYLSSEFFNKITRLLENL